MSNVRGPMPHLSPMHRLLSLLTLTSLGFAQPARADAVEDAYRLCKAMESSGVTTECTVSGYHSRVDVTIDTNGTEARKICAGVVEQMAQKTRSFNGRWK